MFRTCLLREAGLIYICKEVIQRNKAVVPGGEKTQRVWRKSGTFIHASASHYFMYWYKSILCFLRDGGSEWILTALVTLRGDFLYFFFIFQFTCTHYLYYSSINACIPFIASIPFSSDRCPFSKLQRYTIIFNLRMKTGRFYVFFAIMS